MHLIDWLIVVALVAVLFAGALATRKYTRSVADFLAASRCGGRYILTVATGTAATGVITMVWYFEIGYDVGFTSTWWSFLQEPAYFIIALSGWVVYRFRQTRAMTLAQYFEMRYSRNFRVFAGLVAFLSGIVNFGIFPSIGARFFMWLCNLPEYFPLLGMEISTFAAIMAILLFISLVFTFLGGQIAIMVTDFIQGIFGNIVFVAVIIFLLVTFSWTQVSETMLMAPAGKSVVNPFDLGKEENFNIWFYLIAILTVFYGIMGWQGTAGYNCAAKSAHENKMAWILGGWRFRVFMIITLVVPIFVRTFLQHPDFADQASVVQARIGALDGEELQRQARVPLAMTVLLPTGLLGLMCAAMLAAFISTHDTYLHSWGSMFIQDVILPFRKKPFTPKQHLRLLRFSILGVALFIFCFSLLFKHEQHIAMYCAISGSVFIGGAGIVIIGGLYWNRGTTAAAWTSMISGLILSFLGALITQGWIGDLEAMRQAPFWNALSGLLGRIGLSGTFWAAAEFVLSLNGQEISFWVIVFCVILYLSVSLLRPGAWFNMERLLHRGRYAVAGETSVSYRDARTIAQKLGFTKEFTLSDKIVACVTMAWPLLWFMVFLAGSLYYLGYGISDKAWIAFWRIWIWITLGTLIALIIWFAIGGIKDLKYLFYRLRTFEPDLSDDGRVERGSGL